MMEKQLINLNDFKTIFTMDTCDIRISTRKIAEHFGKQHKHILRDVEKAECSIKFAQSNFGLSAYTDSTGRNNKEYLLTEKGFNFIVLGYTGKKAAEYREAYIEAFDKLKKYYLRRQKKAINKTIARNSEFIKEASLAGWSEDRIKRDLRPKRERTHAEVLEDLQEQFGINRIQDRYL